MNFEPNNKLSLEWFKGGPDGKVGLIFDAKTWKLFEDVAAKQEQSAEHMITRAVVNCLGSITEDNMVLNRILRGSD
jgi:hypothetical protein